MSCNAEICNIVYLQNGGDNYCHDVIDIPCIYMYTAAAVEYYASASDAQQMALDKSDYSFFLPSVVKIRKSWNG